MIRISVLLAMGLALSNSFDIADYELVSDDRGPGMPFLHKPAKLLLGSWNHTYTIGCGDDTYPNEHPCHERNIALKISH